MTELKGVIVLKETFLDKIYDFARSRLSVCENKLLAMGYVPGDEGFYKADILQLKEYEKPEDSVLLKRVVDRAGKEEYFLEISSEENSLLNSVINELELMPVDYQ